MDSVRRYSELRVIFSKMRDAAKSQWPKDGTVQYIVVRCATGVAWPRGADRCSSFIFLRFFCPAILNPKLFNMMPGAARLAARGC